MVGDAPAQTLRSALGIGKQIGMPGARSQRFALRTADSVDGIGDCGHGGGMWMNPTMTPVPLPARVRTFADRCEFKAVACVARHASNQFGPGTVAGLPGREV